MNIRTWAAVLASIAAAGGIAACGGSSNSGSTNAGATTAATTNAANTGGSTGTTGGSASAIAPGTLNGAGSTFAAPIYQQWSSILKPKGLTVNYNPVGSGTGVTDLQTATVTFAGNDPPLTSADKKGMKGPVLQFPVAFGAITISYNLPGVKSGLKLTGPLVADIFLGKVKTWDDPAIKALNPGVKLPSTAITVVHRSDSSGTTASFTTYLSQISPQWKSSLGAGDVVKWPVGTGGNGNTGVAAAVKQTTGAVGYVEQAYALVNHFTFAQVRNSSGKYVLPTIQNTSAAASGVHLKPDLGMITVNSPTPTAYPIASQSFLVSYQDPCKDGHANSATAKSLKSFLTYALGAGQKTLGSGSGQIPYAPLPASIDKKATAQLSKLTCNGSPIS